MFGLSMLYYWLAYFIVTMIGVLHTIFNIKVLHMGTMKDGPGMGEGYKKTRPWHPLYNIIIFPLFAWLYLRAVGDATLDDAILTALIWGTLTIIFDLFGWVIIKHPWSLSWKEFYIDYQPWITLTYLVIYLSPLLAFFALTVL